MRVEVHFHKKIGELLDSFFERKRGSLVVGLSPANRSLAVYISGTTACYLRVGFLPASSAKPYPY